MRYIHDSWNFDRARAERLIPRRQSVIEVARVALVSFLACSGIVPGAQAADLLVSTTGNGISRFDGTTGASLGYFVSPGAGGLSGPGNFIFGPDGNLYVSSNGTASVKRYDGVTGAYINDFVAPGSGSLADPGGLAFGPDGNLYVAVGAHSAGGGKVARYSGATGAYLDDFVPNGSGGISYAQDLVFGPDGNLYVCDGITNSILRYNGVTGAFINVFAAIGSGDPTSLRFGADGNLYVSLFYGHAIKRFNGATGAAMGDFVPSGTGGLLWDFQISFGPDGNLYETERYGRSVKRYNGVTGAYIADFVTGLAGEVLGLQWFPSAPPCALSQQMSYSNTTLTLGFNLHTQVAATWRAWLVTQSGSRQLLSKSVPVIDPARTFVFTVPSTPVQGSVGVLSSLSNTSNGLLCSAWSTVNTGKSGLAGPEVPPPDVANSLTSSR
jgi:streptogramin lyase